MITRQVEITTECYFDDGGGIAVDFYIGDASEPVICEMHSFRDIIDSYVESLLNSEGKLTKPSYAGVTTLLDSLKEAAEFANLVAREKGYGEDK